MTFDKAYQVLPFSIREDFRNLYDVMLRRSMKKFYSQIVRSGDLVFDIGANIGHYTKIFYELGANVICLEPQPYCVKKLESEFASDPKIKIVDKGVASYEREMELNIDLENHATATFSEKFIKEGPFNNRKWDKKVVVQMTTLDKLIVQFGVPKYCKIDVEGFELEVIKGLSQQIPLISFEYSRSMPEIMVGVVDHLNSLGDLQFNFTYFDSPFKFELKEWSPDREYVFDLIKRSKRKFAGDLYVRFV